MTEREAVAEARRRWGAKASAGGSPFKVQTFNGGPRQTLGYWVTADWFACDVPCGTGNTFEEAFDNAE